MTLVRPPTPGHSFVRSEGREGPKKESPSVPTIESYASTLPIELSAPNSPESKMQPESKSKIPEVFQGSGNGSNSGTVLSVEKTFGSNPLLTTGRSRSLPQKRSSGTGAAAEKKSSSGFNCILDENTKPAGTHRSNQAESTAQEYQQLLDGVQVSF